jgi:hypothetical protein
MNKKRTQLLKKRNKIFYSFLSPVILKTFEINTSSPVFGFERCAKTLTFIS